ncbi:uncharacterized protein LY89DRAFT_730109 [Mollisia scopiformis]|uniref:Uncharacterized protein n=1 Tax=Mollisia scopiformis TaxID=149040 RepID=A0A194XMH1_MOLSC|nr:uncharacterized protein LY89DRAFT_730109 [Mollisia scopiformis]KUJ21326.1 hypothetical protein LY89DRAFT_730109 [Mollisia scopiformis]
MPGAIIKQKAYRHLSRSTQGLNTQALEKQLSVNLQSANPESSSQERMQAKPQITEDLSTTLGAAHWKGRFEEIRRWQDEKVYELLRLEDYNRKSQELEGMAVEHELLKTAYNSLLKENKILDSNVKLAQKVQRLKERNEILSTANERLREEIQNFKHGSQLAAESSNLKDMLEATKASHDELQQKTQGYKAIQKENAQLQKTANGLRRTLLAAQEEKGNLRKDNEQMMSKLATLNPFKIFAGPNWYPELSAKMTKVVKDRWSGRFGSRYTKVRALMTRWESDDLGVASEIAALSQVLEDNFGYEVSTYLIPDLDSENSLVDEVARFLGDSAADELVVFYYGVHVLIHTGGYWAARKTDNSPTLRAAEIQRLFERSSSDSLLLFDSCHAAQSSNTTNPANALTELIVACGFDSVAPGVGSQSFTHNLIQVLQSLSKEGPFPVHQLFNQTLHYCRNRIGRTTETAPVHCSLTGVKGGRRMMLHPLVPAPVPPRASIPKNALSVGIAVEDDFDEKEWEEWILRAPTSAECVLQLRVASCRSYELVMR